MASATHESVILRVPDSHAGLCLNHVLEMEMEDLATVPVASSPPPPPPPSSSPSRGFQDEGDSEDEGDSDDSDDSPTHNSVWCFPPFEAAVPAINEVSSKLAETASLFGRQIVGFVEEAVQIEGRHNVGETSSELSLMDPGAVDDDDTEPLLLQQRRNEIPGERLIAVPTASTSRDGDDMIMTPTAQGDMIMAVPNVGGGAVSLFNATSAAMVGMRQSLITGPPAVWQGLVSRVQTTLRGSADDIGWLQKDATLPPVTDKTERFLQLLGRISHGVHILPKSLVYLLVPGLFSNHGPLYFIDTKKYFIKLGLDCHIARIHSEAAVEKNARELKEFIEELHRSTGKRVLLLGHSKGGVDAAAACAKYWTDLKDKVVGLVFAQSPYGGTPIASDILREGQIADLETRRILELLVTKVIKGDMQSLEDLTYEKRRAFVAAHPLPEELLTVSFHTEASRGVSVLSTMSHIAHAEIPWLPGGGGATSTSEEAVAGAKVPVAIPLPAAMAMCALHLDLRYGEKSDGLVARRDAEVPGSVVVRPEKKLDHAWMVYAPSRKEFRAPDAAQMWEALLTLLLEEETARNAASSHQDDSILSESEEVSSSSVPEVPATEIQEGKEYLENL